MQDTDLATFEAALVRLREVDSLLEGANAGVCLLHLDACIGALESRIRRHGMSAEQRLIAEADDAARAFEKPLSKTS
jgi:hypothetical protein